MKFLEIFLFILKKVLFVFTDFHNFDLQTSVHSRLGPGPSNSSPTRNIINLREESSFPPRSDSRLASTVSSAVNLISSENSNLPSPSSSGRKLEVCVFVIFIFSLYLFRLSVSQISLFIYFDYFFTLPLFKFRMFLIL